MTNRDNINDVLTSLINNKEIADVKFVVGKEKKEYYCNKLFLQNCSPVWKEQLYDPEWRNKTQDFVTLEIADVESEIFLVILQYVYTRKPVLTDRNCLRVQEAADKFKIDGLGAMAMLFMTKNISPQNCFDILKKAQGYKDALLESKVFDFLMRDEGVFKVANILVGVKEENIKTILGFRKCTSSEYDIFHRVIEWGKWKLKEAGIEESPEALKDVLSGLLPLVKLILMGPEQLKEIKALKLYETKVIFDYSLNLIDRYKGRSFKTSRGIPGLSKETIQVLHLSANTENWIKDLKESILCTGLTNYTYISAQKTTPSVETLKKYHVVWVNSGNSFQNPTQLGDNLAKYVDAGGSVVIGGVHTLRSDNANWVMKGKLATGNYLPFKKGSLVQNKRCTLKTIVEKDHMIMRGVKTFDGGRYSSHVNTSINSGGIPICKWSDDQVLIAEKPREMGNTVVAINIRPASSKVDGSWWDINTDGRLLIGNSVEYAGKMSKIELAQK
ncbi:pep-cterm sorting domain-containing protein [Anaeramoeba flamelloides]|uniref:Pep-cterm sorting domain-containing protein n=1 Tax=Anaeramoeba flamelloides TaxID=1746091 RepID=A0AAV7ZW77_9EUKA|nr:pep-cterm sorting domain-containing protein [Anaeramoeba flamelloides]